MDPVCPKPKVEASRSEAGCCTFGQDESDFVTSRTVYAFSVGGTGPEKCTFPAGIGQDVVGVALEGLIVEETRSLARAGLLTGEALSEAVLKRAGRICFRMNSSGVGVLGPLLSLLRLFSS